MGEFSISKKLTLSLQGLDFINRCLDYNEYTRLSIEEMFEDNYLAMKSQEYVDIKFTDELLNKKGDKSEKLTMSIYRSKIFSQNCLTILKKLNV